MSLPDAHIETTVPVLVEVLRDVPYIDFDHCLAWDGMFFTHRVINISHVTLDWALPDQLVFKTVSALLRTSSTHPEYRRAATQALISFSERILNMLQTGDCEYLDLRFLIILNETCSPAFDILTQFAPAFHGFYRAIISIPYQWTIEDWAAISNNLNTLFLPEVVEHLNRLLIDILKTEEDPDKVHFVQTLLARYISRGRPLTGYFLVCCVLEAQWTTLAQALTKTEPSGTHPQFAEAAAANMAWQSLLQQSIDAPSQDENFQNTVRQTMENAMQTFSNLLVQIEAMDRMPSEDSYAWETMSESLVSFSEVSRVGLSY